MPIESINPTTGEVIKQYQEMAPDTVRQILEESEQAFQSWRRTSFAETPARCARRPKILRKNADEYARLIWPAGDGQTHCRRTCGSEQMCVGV